MKGNRYYSPINLLFLTALVMIFLSDIVFAQIVVEKENNDTIMLWLEAEAGGIESPMKVWDRNDASGGQFIQALDRNNNTVSAPEDGRITYKFTIKKAGTYKVWGRVSVSGDDEYAFWVKVDNEEWIKWNDISRACNWHWQEIHDNEINDQVKKIDLAEGPHTIILAYLMDPARLDKLLITNDLKYIPNEIGPGVKNLFKMSSATPTVHETVHFDASESVSSEGTIVSYEWDFGEGSKASGKSVIYAYKKEGDYQVKLIVTDDKGLSSRLTKTLTVYNDDPVVSFVYSPDRSKPDESINFDASPSFDPNGELKKYIWDFGDGSKGKGAKVKHSYASAGEYSATLTVTDSEGKTVKEIRLVTVITGVPKKVIYETDMCLDVDDVGALAVLHAMTNNSEVELLAVCFNEVHPYGASAIDAINTWYGHGEIPVGIYKNTLADPDPSAYLDALKKFPHDLDQDSAPSALDVYKKVLSEQPDKSVTIVSVGFLNNLSDLISAEPDLVAQKVNELVIMGGLNNDGFNLSRHNLVSASENVIRNWPSPLVISQPGTRIKTGERLENSPEENPVREAYYQFFYSNFCGRPSWDQVAVLYGVRGLSDYFSENTTETGSLRNGYKWQMKPGHRSFIEALLPVDSYAKITEDLMLEPPVK